jgi:protease-4
MNKEKLGFWRRIANVINRLARVVRTFISFIFLGFLVLVISGMFVDELQPVPEQGALYLAPNGMLVDQRSYIPPIDQLLSGQNASESETLVREIIEVLQSASNDDRITHLVLDTSYMQGAGVAKLEEISSALLQFKKTGKPIIAIADNFTQSQYFLAAHADHILLNPLGTLMITGFGAYGSYYKDALEKLRINVHVFRAGIYKNAVEPLIRNDMSVAAREETYDVVSRLWAYYSSKIEELRGLDNGSINDLANNLHIKVAETNGDMALLAQREGLVDQLATRSETLDYLDQQIPGTDGKFNSIDMWSYLEHINRQSQTVATNSDKIAVVMAKGTILDGEQPEGTIGGDTLSAILNNLDIENEVKAVVLRIDSPGGSAFASELIRDAVDKIAQKDVPIVVSMGSYAASGGYWIAAQADAILAQSTSITGSIGVYSMIPTVENSLAALGIYSDGVGSTDIAGIRQLDRSMSDETKVILQASVENIYNRFLGLVAEGRDRTITAVDKMARGRVWTGQQALELGLVDAIGGLDEAIQVAAELAQLENYDLLYPRRYLSPQEEFLRQLTSNISLSLGHIGMTREWLPERFFADTESLLRPLIELSEFNDPRGIYLHCDNCPL